MRFFAGMARKALAGAAVSGAFVLTSAPSYAQTASSSAVTTAITSTTSTATTTSTAAGLPAITLPTRFRNQPANAITSSARDPALGEAELARLIALTLQHSPARAQAAARVNAVRPGFMRSGDAEKRALEADLARADDLLAEEVAHAWFDGRAADARLDVARAMDALAAQGLLLVNQRVAAGLATQADLERLHEAAIKSRSLAARAAQERGAAAARIAALSGEQVAGFASVPDAASAAHSSAAPASAAPLSYAIRASTPATLQERADVRAARIRATLALEQRDASAPELVAFYRESVHKALEETENAYAASVNARAQRASAAELAAAATRQAGALLVQLEAGRIGRLPHVEAQLPVQDARLRIIDAELQYAKSLASLERASGP